MKNRAYSVRQEEQHLEEPLHSKLMEAQHYFSWRLLTWFREHQRNLPWRESKDPYRIWVSEIMLQQTRVDTVIPYYLRFMAKFPSVDILAEAPEEDVLKAWEGLGYYSRARNLQTAVREVRDKYEGVVPDGREQLASLKGVGPYTAGAILSIAFNQPEPAVDGNVMRVLSRYFLIEDDVAKASTRIYMENLVRKLIPQGTASDFNQGLMELGALVCTPKSPGCLTCPVMERCAGRLEGQEERLPVKTKAKPPRPEYRLVAWIRGGGAGGTGVGDGRGKVLIRQRPEQGLLARMWELPHMELLDRTAGWDLSDEQCMALLRESLATEEGIRVNPVSRLMDAEHTFSHIHWNMRVYECEAEEPESQVPVHYQWIDASQKENYPFPNVFLRIMKQAGHD